MPCFHCLLAYHINMNICILFGIIEQQNKSFIHKIVGEKFHFDSSGSLISICMKGWISPSTNSKSSAILHFPKKFANRKKWIIRIPKKVLLIRSNRILHIRSTAGPKSTNILFAWICRYRESDFFVLNNVAGLVGHENTKSRWITMKNYSNKRKNIFRQKVWNQKFTNHPMRDETTTVLRNS